MDTSMSGTSTADSDIRICYICKRCTTEKLVNVGSKGKATLQKASIERQDDIFRNITNLESILVHASCRADYVHRHNIEAAKRKTQLEMSPVKRKLRKSSCSSLESVEAFDWITNCVICGGEADMDKERKKSTKQRVQICIITLHDFVKNLLKLISIFTDDYHREIYKRISSVSDLIVLKARYHKQCYRNLQK